MDVVKRIEVLKGASSALYGSDAIAGVINIITDDPKSALNVSDVYKRQAQRCSSPYPTDGSSPPCMPVLTSGSG